VGYLWHIGLILIEPAMVLLLFGIIGKVKEFINIYGKEIYN
jgi:hypothetical protein